MYIKVETVFFMVNRSKPVVVFEEILSFIQILIDYFGCDTHENCLDIGETQHSTAEAARVIDIYDSVL